MPLPTEPPVTAEQMAKIPPMSTDRDVIASTERAYRALGDLMYTPKDKLTPIQLRRLGETMKSPNGRRLRYNWPL